MLGFNTPIPWGLNEEDEEGVAVRIHIPSSIWNVYKIKQ